MPQIQLIHKNNQGIGLIETLLAVIFSISLILALITLTNFNIRNATLVEKNQDALNSTNKLLESLKVIKDQGFVTFKNSLSYLGCTSSSTAFCYIDYTAPAGSQIKIFNQASNDVFPVSYFRYEIVSDSEIKINTLTEWKVGSKNFSSPLSTTFTNWKVRN